MIGRIIAALRGKPPLTRKPPGTPTVSYEMPDFEAEWAALADHGARPEQMPCWAMTLRPPFGGESDVRSWLGGTPKMPDGAPWPRDSSGLPLLFAGQIDLADIRPEPETGQRPPRLPESGALLMFAGGDEAVVIVFDAVEMADAVDRAAPGDVPSLRDRGFWIEGSVFPRWPVDLHPFLETRGGPVRGPFPPQDAMDLLVTWADAALEAETTAHWLGVFHGQRTRELEHRLSKPVIGDRAMQTREAQVAHARRFIEQGPEMAEAIADWGRSARSRPPSEPVDRDALGEIFARRRDWASPMVNFPEKSTLVSGSARIFQILETGNTALRRDVMGRYDFSAVPPEHRESVTRDISRWSGHRLFGQGWIRDDLELDLRGKDAVFTILSDRWLGTQSEHEDGFSGWFDRPGPDLGETRGSCALHTTV